MDRELDELAGAAEDLRQPWYVGHVAWLRAMRARLGGRYDEAEGFAAHALEVGSRAGDPTAERTYVAHRLDLCRERGDLHDVEPELARLAAQYPGLGLVRYLPAWLHAELGRHAAARAEIDRLAARDFADVDRDM